MTTERARQLLGAHGDPKPRGLFLRVFRRIARELVWIFVWILDLGRRFGAVLLRTEYQVAGGCQKRGACCHHILLEWNPLFDRHRWLGAIVLWKLTRFYSFYDKGYSWEIDDKFIARVLGCHALRSDGSCGEYRLRPFVCRTFPELPLVGKPMLLKGCGYKFVRRDGAPDLEEPASDSLPRRLEPSSRLPIIHD